MPSQVHKVTCPNSASKLFPKVLHSPTRPLNTTNMRSSLRLLNLEASSLQGSRPRYVCSTCRQSARPRPLVARQFLRHASDNSTPITERVRRKLWGTDKPPGLEDPYGDNSVLWKKKEGGAAPEPPKPQQEEEPVEEPTSGDYEPALDGKRLAHVGHLGRWKDLPPKVVDAYNPYVVFPWISFPGCVHLNWNAVFNTDSIPLV